MQHTYNTSRISITQARWVVPLFIAAAVMLLPHEAQAQVQPGNESDVTGVNVSDITGNNVTDVLGLNLGGTGAGSIADRAQQLLTQLEQARTACEASKAQAAEQPRRFARGPADSNEECISAECQRYNQLMSEARVFLSNLDRTQQEIRQRIQTARFW